MPRNWGASVKEEVLALDDIRDRAFKMANELLGAYDQVSEMGKDPCPQKASVATHLPPSQTYIPGFDTAGSKAVGRGSQIWVPEYFLH